MTRSPAVPDTIEERAAVAALEAAPEDPAARLRLAALLVRRGAFVEAVGQMEQAERLGERSAKLHYNLGLAYARLGDSGRAAARYRQALAIDPAHAAARNNLGQALVAAGDLAGAESLYREALAAADDPRAHNNLGLVLILRDDLAGAGRHLRAAIALQPDYGHAHYNLALWHDRRQDFGAAAAAYRRTLACGNAPARAAYGLAVIEQTRGRADLAIPLYAHTLAHDPADQDARANLAIALQEEGRLDEALEQAEELLARHPDHPSGIYVRGWVRLLRGDLAGGYAGYDVRWRRPDPGLRQHCFPAPLWNGEPLGPGRKLLLWGEFGVGDELVMAGLLDDVLARGVAVVLECDPRFVTLFRRSWPAVTVVPRGDPPDGRTRAPDIAAQSSLMRLPMLFRQGMDDFPRHAGYLRPDPERVRRHRDGFAALGPGIKVGLAWSSGNPRTGGRKSIRLEQWAPVLAVPGVRFVSLQYADATEEIARARADGLTALHPNPNPDLRDDLEDLAAQVAALDAVVTIAGINAHMAGALGRPGLVLVPRTPLWFWFDHGERSPWYPSLRLVRQAGDGNWDAPIARLAALLAEIVARQD